MKKIIAIISFLLLENIAMGQPEVYIVGGCGIGNYYSKRDPIVTPYKLSPILSYSIGVNAKIETSKKHKPIIGLHYLRTGSDYRNTFLTSPISFRFHYLNLPIGLDINICGGLGANASISASFPIAYDVPKFQEAKRPGMDFGLIPALFYRFNKWELNATYLLGFSDAAKIGHLGETDYRLYNRVFLLKLGYRIHSMNTK